MTFGFNMLLFHGDKPWSNKKRQCIPESELVSSSLSSFFSEIQMPKVQGKQGMHPGKLMVGTYKSPILERKNDLNHPPPWGHGTQPFIFRGVFGEYFSPANLHTEKSGKLGHNFPWKFNSESHWKYNTGSQKEAGSSFQPVPSWLSGVSNLLSNFRGVFLSIQLASFHGFLSIAPPRWEDGNGAPSFCGLLEAVFLRRGRKSDGQNANFGSIFPGVRMLARHHQDSLHYR